MIIYIASDHRGFGHKEVIKKYLADFGYTVVDFSGEKYDEADDYPDFASKVAEKISKDPNNSRGILICGSGAGVDIVANKFSRVRSSLVFNTEQAIDVRADDDANVLSLAASYTSLEDSKKITSLWLNTKFSGEEKHKRRIKKIEEIEIKLR
ncbi:RpiB/LacA/LacB family sugar-phosphate isomerase [Patescibacteria group bacterium]|nr:RpiB/LacA/LacB family sugar-phosphate isomerase [Patescibacteria group bacterium]